MNGPGLRMLVDDALFDPSAIRTPQRVPASATEVIREPELLTGIAVCHARLSGMTLAQTTGLFQIPKQATHRQYRTRPVEIGREGD